MMRAERGTVLFIALIVLVAMMLAGVALMRSVGSGTILAGNLTFKRAATSAGDYGIELGRKWLQDNGNALLATNAANGYYAHWGAGNTFDPATHDWAASSGPFPGVAPEARGRRDPQGNLVRFVIHRMCDPSLDGAAADPVKCTVGAGATSGISLSNSHYQHKALTGGSAPYYRITARVDGPKQTLSFVQAIVQ
jgi:type IV pilus assembly protein PilX